MTIRDCTADGGSTICYMWHEAIGKRGSKETASCVKKKLESLPENVTHVITYSDTYGGQNRHVNMVSMFSYFVRTHVNCVDQKFLRKKNLFMFINDSGAHTVIFETCTEIFDSKDY